jgi:uncharacterized protein YjbJ (UPF0337 family)
MKDKLRGKAEVAKGKLTGKRTDVLKGKARQALGSVKQAGEEIAYDADRADRKSTTRSRRPV